MIAFVRGTILSVKNDSIIVDTGNIGYTVFVPMAMMKPYPKTGEEIMLFTYLQVKEDGWALYGFSEEERLTAFKLFLNVSGIGAKSALAIINTLTVQAITLAIINKDISAFTAVSGIGKKTAERLLLELKDKFKSDISAETAVESSYVSSYRGEAASALIGLGFSPSEARALTSQAVLRLGETAAAEDIIKDALRQAAKF